MPTTTYFVEVPKTAYTLEVVFKMPELKKGMLAAIFKGQAKIVEKSFTKAAKRAAERAKSVAVNESPSDTGLFRQSWEVVERDGQVVLRNNHPMAGVIEEGARPHPVSKEGQEALAKWVRRKQPDLDDAQVKSMVFAMCVKLKKEGQEAHYIIASNLGQFQTFLQEEIARELQNAAKAQADKIAEREAKAAKRAAKAAERAAKGLPPKAKKPRKPKKK